MIPHKEIWGNILVFETPTRRRAVIDVWDALMIIHNEVRPVKGERAAYAQALAIFGAYMYGRAPDYRETGKWLCNLAEALDDLDDGIERPVFRGSKLGHRRAHPVHIKNGRAYVAGGVEALIRSGLAPKPAAKEALRKVKKIPRGIETATILGWRDELKKKRNADKISAIIFRHCARLSRGSDVGRLRVVASHCFIQANRLLGLSPHS
jgi:hypothetical protein